MNKQELIQKIEQYIGEGQTEAAVKALVEYTKMYESSNYDEALLLSGRFKQWKREKMLGVQQSSDELRHIEMGILTLLQGQGLELSEEEKAALKKAEESQTFVPTNEGRKNKTGLWIAIAILAIIAVGFGVKTMQSSKKADLDTLPDEVKREEPVTVPKDQAPKDNGPKVLLSCSGSKTGARVSFISKSGQDIILQIDWKEGSTFATKNLAIQNGTCQDCAYVGGAHDPSKHYIIRQTDPNQPVTVAWATEGTIKYCGGSTPVTIPGTGN